MRLNSEQIGDIANRIVRGLVKREYFDVEDADETELLVRQVIADELRVEDKLNDEVRELMREHMDRIRRADVEYHEMFKVIKARLAKERNIIL
ncbi:MAG: DUF507 family protein [Acidobacteria bacterium]|nr:DUF507 family protein [Acidobacteriota bacterium]